MVSPVPVAFYSPLVGNEQLTAYGIGLNGQPSGENFQLSTSQISRAPTAPDLVGAARDRKSVV